jgi:hypothetical protein
MREIRTSGLMRGAEPLAPLLLDWITLSFSLPGSARSMRQLVCRIFQNALRGRLLWGCVAGRDAVFDVGG